MVKSGEEYVGVTKRHISAIVGVKSEQLTVVSSVSKTLALIVSLLSLTPLLRDKSKNITVADENLGVGDE